jgi:hypothetical protein
MMLLGLGCRVQGAGFRFFDDAFRFRVQVLGFKGLRESGVSMMFLS